jgi:dephospho-CoA kinase
VVLLVGLTGGIGAGKSTVARMLAERGAVVIDADDLARRAVDPGTPGFEAVVEAFGPDVLTPDGGLDRTRLASIVFTDEEARRRLESIVHPEVTRLFAEEAGRYRDGDGVVVYVVPLLVENHLEGMFDIVVVVTAEREARVARLESAREMGEDDIRGRMDAQLGDREREAVAHLVIPNDGSIQELQGNVDDLWARIVSGAEEPSGP